MTETLTRYEVRGVPSGLVPHVWPGVEHLVAQAADRWPGDFTADDYFAACRCAEAQLWLISDAGKLTGIVITRILTFPVHRVAVIDLMAGDGWDEWSKDFAVVVEAWARAEGCARIRSGGRRGLTKAAEREGYRVVGVIVEKDLADG